MAHIQWSKLRKAVESFFAESVKGRVGLHSTRYRTTHDQDGRAWITLDGRQVVNMPEIWVHLRELDERSVELAATAGISNKYGDPGTRSAANIQLMNEEKFMQPDLGRAMHDYLSASITEILASENPVIRAIGMLDRRVGARRLAQMDLENEHPLVRELASFRLRAESERRARAKSGGV